MACQWKKCERGYIHTKITETWLSFYKAFVELLQQIHQFIELIPYLAVETSAPLSAEGKHWQCLAKGDWDRGKKKCALTWSTSAVSHALPLSNGPSRRCSPLDLSGLLLSLLGWASCLSPLVVRIFDRSSKTKRFRRQQKRRPTLLHWASDW